MQPARYPIGFWNFGQWLIDPEAHVAEWADLGFTLAMTPPFGDTPEEIKKVKSLLNLAHSRGIQLLLFDRRTFIPNGNWGNPAEPVILPDDYPEKVAAMLRDFDGHPAAWGVIVTDEPLQGGLPALGEACQLIRAQAKRLQPYVNLLPDHIIGKGVARQIGFTDFNAYLDHYLDVTGDEMLSYDCYSQNSPAWGGRDRYFLNLAEYQAAALRHDIPFWNIILSIGHWRYTVPTVDEMRWQFYTSLAYGAQGILYFLYRAGGDFGYGAPVDELGQRGPLYPQLRRQHAHFQQAWEPVFRGLTPARTSHFPTAPAGTRLFDGSGVVKEIHCEGEGTAVLVGEFVDAQGRPHVVLVNNETERMATAWAVCNGKQAYRMTVSGEQPFGKASENGQVTLEVPVPPGMGALYRIE
ncbi:MAG: hypothetical protein ACYC7E_01315 [Armatimonadota bacterium]